jgi:selenophosphate synthetase-related protein
MGALRLGGLDALAAPDAAHATRVMSGVRDGAEAFGLPVLGGHTQLGVPAALSVTALGRAARPVPGGGGRPGDDVVLTADLAGGWRPGYEGRQWDSTSGRRAHEIGATLDAVARGRPRAAKDVSMAGVAGTLGMLAEAGGCGAELDLARVPRPRAARLADWLTCFPGFALLSADSPGRALPAGPASGACCGRLVAGSGVRLVWPDGEAIQVLEGGATGLGRA